MINMVIREKRHRLPKKFYKGRVVVSITLCLKGRYNATIDAFIVREFTDILKNCVDSTECIVPAYCFMPDHQHIVFYGKNDRADVYKAIIKYKQKTGYWLSRNKLEIRWQKDFYDHIIRERSEIAVQIKYILDNPVRKGLVSTWYEYPFKGSIGCELEDVMNGII